MATVLLVDDEVAILDLVRLYLEKEGHLVLPAPDAATALTWWEKERPDLVVLDVGLPDMDGFALCRRLRLERQTPILMLTARDETSDRILGLELGADDYLTKPFHPLELLARVRAILRRIQPGWPVADAGGVLVLGALRLDPRRREVRAGDRILRLRTREFDLLQALLEHQGMVLTREQLLERVWGMDFLGETRTVDVHVSALRDKLTGAGVHIETLRSVGYKLSAGEVTP